MIELSNIKGVDIYLLDQLLKGKIHSGQRILDAGCGNGRNLKFLIQQGFDTMGIDPKNDCIEKLRSEYPSVAQKFVRSDIEQFGDSKGFGAIICNAVLHFAKNHDHFDQLIDKLLSLLNKDGILFIRMTSDIGIETIIQNGVEGVFVIPDGSTRYLLTRRKADELVEKYGLTLDEPVKTVNVDGQRCMTTLVLRK